MELWTVNSGRRGRSERNVMHARVCVCLRVGINEWEKKGVVFRQGKGEGETRSTQHIFFSIKLSQKMISSKKNNGRDGKKTLGDSSWERG